MAPPLRQPRRDGGSAPEFLVEATVKMVERLGAWLELPMEESTLETGGLCTSMLKGSSIAGMKLFKSLGGLVLGWRMVGIWLPST